MNPGKLEINENMSEIYFRGKMNSHKSPDMSKLMVDLVFRRAQKCRHKRVSHGIGRKALMKRRRKWYFGECILEYFRLISITSLHIHTFLSDVSVIHTNFFWRIYLPHIAISIHNLSSKSVQIQIETAFSIGFTQNG